MLLYDLLLMLFGVAFASPPKHNDTSCNTSTAINTTNPGECINPLLIDLDVICTMEYNPVCGCDGNSYPNSCHAYYYYGVTSWTPGECYDIASFEFSSVLFSYDISFDWDWCIDPTQIDPNAICILVYEPVCGCNDVTYSNECFAYYAGVQYWMPGECY